MSRKRRREPRNASLSTSNTSRSSDSLARPNNKRLALPQKTHKPSTIEPYRRRYLMLKTASASIFTLVLAVAVPAAHAQFGSGIVFDPTQSTHAYTQIVQQGKSLENEATQIEQGTRIYTNAVKMATTALNTYGTVMRQYNLYHQMVQSPRMLYSRFLSPRSDLFLMQQIGNTYGNSMGWVNSANTGTGAAAAWQQVSVPTTTSTIAGYNNLTIAGQQQIAAQGATIDIGDSVTSTNLQALGTIRANQQARQTDIPNRETPDAAPQHSATARAGHVATHQVAPPAPAAISTGREPDQRQSGPAADRCPKTTTGRHESRIQRLGKLWNLLPDQHRTCQSVVAKFVDSILLKWKTRKHSGNSAEGQAYGWYRFVGSHRSRVPVACNDGGTLSSNPRNSHGARTDRK